MVTETQIHPTAIVEAGARLDENVQIGPFCHVGPQAVIGAGTRLISHVSVSGQTTIGRDCTLYPFAALGGQPQIISVKASDSMRLEIGDRCVFRECATAHVGSPAHGGLTRLGNDCFIMIGAHVAHDCMLGENVVMANNVSLAGHIEIGDHVWMGGHAAIHQFSRIGRQAFIGGGAIVVADVPPFCAAVGNHATLAGLNVVGLKRRGYSKADLHQIRAAYRAVFEGEGMFLERASKAATEFVDRPLASEFIEFILADASRPICKPA
jgi:UDP-N-acetylglucosamine acyltransferase